MDFDLLTAIGLIKEDEGKAALVTVINTKGSTPRKAGSKMLVYPNGQVVGTIGGGCAEAEVKIKALQAIDDGRSFTYEISMLNDAAAEEGMVCGGIMEVFIQIV
ncbi:XdhC family protein [Dendrosporobacter sp. 1207_IL3150]|uniref:XdhC family protein n=1 Tax=Dendrosporobacter sp. 1207_IL3150 TaxID=3084054 RepID=UPI002FDABD39